MSAPGLLSWLLTGHDVAALERRLAAGMAELRACATPAERAAVEERLRPLAAQRKRLVEMARARREAA